MLKIESRKELKLAHQNLGDKDLQMMIVGTKRNSSFASLGRTVKRQKL